jgi:hypothetical protein
MLPHAVQSLFTTGKENNVHNGAVIKKTNLENWYASYSFGLAKDI